VKRSVATRRTYEFGAFRLDPAQRRLERDRENVGLHAKAFDALVYLVEHAGEPVSRRALTEALWPKRVVEENNLTQAISALRRALGEDYVVTLAGRGYQFVAEVRTVEVDPNAVTDEPSNDDADPPPVTTPPTSPAVASATQPLRSRRALLVAASLGAAVIAAIWVYFSPSRTDRAVGAASDGEPAKILVLPLAMASQDPNDRAFADGATQELIGRLRALSGLRVMGPATSSAMRGRSVPDIAAELDLQYVLEGSIVRDGDVLRISAQLSDAAGFSVWPFHGADESIFDVQDELVAGVATQLGASMRSDRAPQPAPSADAAASYIFLAAMAVGDDPTGQVAIDLVDRALQRDGTFVQAWAAKAQMHAARAPSLLLPQERASETAIAEQAADEAVELAPNWGGGYGSRALVRGMRGNWSDAERDYERAQALGHTATSGWVFVLFSAGRVASTRKVVERMLDDDPRNPILLTVLMLSHEMAGQPNEADAVYDRWLRDVSLGFSTGAWAWIQLGRGKVVAADRVGPLMAPFADPALEPADALGLIRSAAVEPQYSTPVARTNLAIWAAHFGRTDLAVSLLADATTEGPLLLYLAWLPVFEKARQTAEFKDLLDRVGLVDYWRATTWPDVCRPLGQSDFTCD
jgi:DNA-binding winged helix-turn-helix (wHTH) protein/TolB-like protein/tetratricopeptide (TPR) repeat protein